ncbi:hypothetical protein OTU49_000057 [Cherax quadricarinatus]|uniref:Fibrinogen C-terminal domain-containing protein n=1 Tax=Cherax quadricarinatus TaxID=27406 RepID=A0AAW0Y194_CHEQU|nr:techylectin-5A-like [Cherax quadricarinatus]
MWRQRGCVYTVVLAVITVTADTAAVQPISRPLLIRGDTEVPSSAGTEVLLLRQLTEVARSLCEPKPELPPCQALNVTLLEEMERKASQGAQQDTLLGNNHLQRDLHQLDIHSLGGVIHTPESSSIHLGYLREPAARGISSYERSYHHAVVARPTDCSDYLLLGYITSGVYKIYPFNCRCTKPVEVWCDMETDGGGWTVFLSRHNLTNRENFNRTWSDYSAGFGNASGEYWLGNEHLHTLTYSRPQTMRMDFQVKDGSLKWGEWPDFLVENADSLYKLTVVKYNALSMIDNCMPHHNARQFSTFDYDNDGNAGKNCAEDDKGGFWYNNCATLNPTIPYTTDGHLNTACLYKVQAKKLPLHGSWMQMKLRPTICNQNIKAVYLNSYNCHNHNE